MKTIKEICSFEALYEAYKCARNGKRNRMATARYEANAIFATERLSHILNNRKYVPSKFEIFTIYEPKKRLIQAPAFVDKVVQHAVVDNYLYEALTKSFIYDSTATQIGKGTHFGLGRITHHMRDYYRKRQRGRLANAEYAQGWVLKADVRKFFASIDHDIVKGMLREKVEDDGVYELMCTYIDTTEIGLPLGYQTSQLLANMYLDKFDHWIKEQLRIKYYGRYSDDFYIIHEDREFLKECLVKIKERLGDLKLELNEKTGIFPLRNGIDYLGFHCYLTETGKVIKKLRQSSKKRMKRRIKKWAKDQENGEVDLKHIWHSHIAWNAHAAHGDTRALREKILKLMHDNFEHITSKKGVN